MKQTKDWKMIGLRERKSLIMINSKIISVIVISIAFFAIFSGEFVEAAPSNINEQEAEDQAAIESLLTPDEQIPSDQDQASSDISSSDSNTIGDSDNGDSEDGDDDEQQSTEQSAASNLMSESVLNQAILDSSNANINFSQKPNNLVDYGQELEPAAGHHYGHHGGHGGHGHHKKHYVSGKLEMGAESGKKGAFKWHDKHVVGGKGRR